MMLDPDTPRRNGGAVGAASHLALHVMGRLTPELLFLLTINTVFILGVFWFLDRQTSSRERLLTPILTACIHEKN